LEALTLSSTAQNGDREKERNRNRNRIIAGTFSNKVIFNKGRAFICCSIIEVCYGEANDVTVLFDFLTFKVCLHWRRFIGKNECSSDGRIALASSGEVTTNRSDYICLCLTQGSEDIATIAVVNIFANKTLTV
jgi:hypothetical protein